MKVIYCSFCGKRKQDALCLVEGVVNDKYSYICDECIDSATEIVNLKLKENNGKID